MIHSQNRDLSSFYFRFSPRILQTDVQAINSCLKFKNSMQKYGACEPCNTNNKRYIGEIPKTNNESKL